MGDYYKIIPYNYYNEPSKHSGYWKKKALDCVEEMGVLDSILINNRKYHTVKNWMDAFERRMNTRGIKFRCVVTKEHKKDSPEDVKFKKENDGCSLLRITKTMHDITPHHKDWKNNHIKTLNLSIRTHTALSLSGITDVRDLKEIVQKDPTRLLRYKNFGRKSFQEIVDAFKIQGVQL